MFKVNGFCCMSLRTSGLVFGWLGIVASTFSICNSVDQLVNNYEIDDIFLKKHEQIPREVVVFVLVASLFNMLASGLLINGITASKHCMLLPWLIIKGVALLIIIPVGFLLFYYASLTVAPIPIAATLFLLTVIGFFCWCWIVVYSLHEEIRTTARKPIVFYESGAVTPYQLFEKY